MIYDLESTSYIFIFFQLFSPTSPQPQPPWPHVPAADPGCPSHSPKLSTFLVLQLSQMGFGMQWGADMRECSFKPRSPTGCVPSSKFLKSTALLEVQNRNLEIDGATNATFSHNATWGSPPVSAGITQIHLTLFRIPTLTSPLFMDPGIPWGLTAILTHPHATKAGQLTRPQDPKNQGKNGWWKCFLHQLIR